MATRNKVVVGCALSTVFFGSWLAGTASAHLHPFNPAAACAPEDTGAGNESTAFVTAPGVQEHWDVEDLNPTLPGVQFLIQLSNPGRADESSGAIAPPGIFTGNPGVDDATSNCN